jgi:hypothetical protein
VKVAKQQREQARLAAAVDPGDTHLLAGMEHQVDRVEQWSAATVKGDVTEGDQ